MPELVHSVGRRLPHGWRDLFRQIILFVGAYQGYEVARGIADSHPASAMSNGMHIIHLEQSLGAFFEPAFQQAFLAHQWVIDLANWMYFNSHFVITTAFLVWLYLYRNDHFNFVRNMFLVAMGLALIGYVLYPTAPPRMFPGAGFTDTIQAFTSTNQDASFTSLLVNPYAAVPSMHIAFSLMVTVWVSWIENISSMRLSLLPGLLAAVEHNRHRERPDVRLFEIGAAITRTGPHRRVAVAWTGTPLGMVLLGVGWFVSLLVCSLHLRRKR